MSRRYDSKTTTFTPDGRLMQVEYAMEAINKVGSNIGILTKEGIVLATQKQETSSLLEKSRESEKIYCIDDHIYAVVSGMTADANYLINYAREGAQQNKYQYNSDILMESLVQRVCDLKQNYTQFGGLRPFGTAFLFAGFDKHNKFQLYSSDPSGNYTGWKATAIGQNNLAANTFLKQEYNEEIGLDDGINIALKAICKTMDTAQPSSQKIEMMVITLQKNKVKGSFIEDNKIDELLHKNKLIKNFDEEL